MCPDLQTLATYLKLARIHNMVPSMLLVVVGAWVSCCGQCRAVWCVQLLLLVGSTAQG